eukprot:CAMPEP_0203687308 /NCGR_PEP_ID=MMETSP0091-20130426/344_1 /ASSEMBLY_ACC=CAM_ASM_001089 /TAXON_ID=426623 /ORGANISM="Chaetoceros affinis, Strain CCMP159" /LENGTH=155 /DNA_ID=CAMNT_0050556631 /DNA_START=60 /DNA_END=527 /DNA_ORIENTATION=+
MLPEFAPNTLHRPQRKRIGRWEAHERTNIVLVQKLCLQRVPANNRNVRRVNSAAAGTIPELFLVDLVHDVGFVLEFIEAGPEEASPAQTRLEAEATGTEFPPGNEAVGGVEDANFLCTCLAQCDCRLEDEGVADVHLGVVGAGVEILWAGWEYFF